MIQETLEQKPQIKGIIWMLIHCLIISLSIAIVKLLSDRCFGAVQIISFYSLISFLVAIPLVFKKDGYEILKLSNLKKSRIYLIKSGFGFLAIIFYFIALKSIPMTDMRAIALFSPVCTFIMAVIFLNEKLSPQKIIVLLTSLVGGYIIINPASVTFYKASILVILAVICWSVVDIIIKKISFKEDEYIAKQIFFSQFFIMIYALTYSWFFSFEDWIMPNSLIDILLILATGFSFFMSSFSIRMAAKNADLTTIMPFDFSGMIFTIVISYILFDELIKQSTMVGSMIVFLSSLYFVIDSQKNKKRRTLSDTSLIKLESEETTTFSACSSASSYYFFDSCCFFDCFECPILSTSDWFELIRLGSQFLSRHWTTRTVDLQSRDFQLHYYCAEETVFS